MTPVEDAWHEVMGRIESACVRSGRRRAEVRLIAVSKFHPTSSIRPLIALGQWDFGESRVQELEDKAAALPTEVRWHLIGALQRNKINKALPFIHMLHSLDGAALADALQRRIQGRTLPVLIQINLGDEPQKAGVPPAKAQMLLEHVQKHCTGLNVQGVMAIPPVEEESRRHFVALRRLRDRLRETSGLILPELSMGMSDDFEIGIEEGATLVRVGSTIFGPRAGGANA